MRVDQVSKGCAHWPMYITVMITCHRWRPEEKFVRKLTPVSIEWVLGIDESGAVCWEVVLFEGENNDNIPLSKYYMVLTIERIDSRTIWQGGTIWGIEIAVRFVDFGICCTDRWTWL